MFLNNIKKMKIGGKAQMIKYGADWIRQVLFDNIVQQRLSRSRNKRLTNPNGDNSLDGLVIDWHLAEYDVPTTNVSTAPVLDTGLAYQPTCAYA